MRRNALFFLLFIAIFAAAGCSHSDEPRSAANSQPISAESSENSASGTNAEVNGGSKIMELTSKVTELEEGPSAVKFEGDHGFDDFLSQGGASSDSEVVKFLSENVISSAGLSFGGSPFGCSTISAADPKGNYIFERNFDWNSCNAMIVHYIPENGYASISTVNTDFINMSGLKLSDLPDEAQAVICIYAPLDGMNEKGLEF